MNIEHTLVRPDLLVDSRTIAQALENQHASSMLLIQNNLTHFEGFGVVRFEIEKPSEASLGGRPTKYALLNEDQCYFLLALSRNTEHVVALKARLVLAFRQARQAAAPALDMTDPLVLAQQYVLAETERRVLASENVELKQELTLAAPKVESFDAYIGTESAHDFGAVAKLIGWGRNKMLEEMRRRKILMTGGAEQNVPYQKYLEKGYFEVKARPVVRAGFEQVTTTTFVTPRGVEFLNRLLGKPRTDEVASPPRPINRGQPSGRAVVPLLDFHHQGQE